MRHQVRKSQLNTLNGPLTFSAFKLLDIKILYVMTKKTNQENSELSIDDVCQLGRHGPDQNHDPQSSQSLILNPDPQ